MDKFRDFLRPTDKIHDFFHEIKEVIAIFLTTEHKNLSIFFMYTNDDFHDVFQTVNLQILRYVQVADWGITRYFPRDKITKSVVISPPLNEGIYDFFLWFSSYTISSWQLGECAFLTCDRLISVMFFAVTDWKEFAATLASSFPFDRWRISRCFPCYQLSNFVIFSMLPIVQFRDFRHDHLKNLWHFLTTILRI